MATAARVFREVGLEGTIAYFASPEIAFAGLAVVIAYYNSAENVEGDWFAFIADQSGTIIDLSRAERKCTGAAELFAEAVEIDARMRGGLALDKTPYLHMLRMPLAQAVALDEARMGADGQTDGFGNECEGHCGV